MNVRILVTLLLLLPACKSTEEIAPDSMVQSVISDETINTLEFFSAKFEYDYERRFSFIKIKADVHEVCVDTYYNEMIHDKISEEDGYMVKGLIVSPDATPCFSVVKHVLRKDYWASNPVTKKTTLSEMTSAKVEKSNFGDFLWVTVEGSIHEVCSDEMSLRLYDQVDASADVYIKFDKADLQGPCFRLQAFQLNSGSEVSNLD